MTSYDEWWMTLLAFICLPSTVFLLVPAINNASAPMPKRLWKLAPWVCATACCLLFGIEGIRFNERAPRVHAQGIMQDSKPGSRSDEPSFTLQPTGGSGHAVRLKAVSLPYVDGSRVDVTYQAGENRVLDLVVLDGRRAGRHYTQTDGMGGSRLMVGAGCAIFGVGLVKFLIDEGKRARKAPPQAAAWPRV